MIKVKVNKVDVHSWVKDLGKELLVVPESDCHQMKLTLPKQLGEGSISGYVFENGISLFILDCFLKQELAIDFAEKQIHSLQFHFCTKGEFKHFIQNGSVMYQLNPLAGSISSNPYPHGQRLLFPSDTKLLHTNLQIDRKDYYTKVKCELDKMPAKLAATFQDLEAKNAFLYHSNYNVATAECIQEMINNDYTGLVRSSFEEAKALELLSLQLKQYADDNNPNLRPFTLKKADLQNILKAKKILASNLQNAPNIKDLSKQVGINQQKLKKGFKQVYGQSVYKYLRNMRLDKAKLLILEGKYSIGDIANLTGYSNQSHFARRFKEKFGVLPKDMRKSAASFIVKDQAHIG